jgi:hypothetical protein
MLTRQLSDLLFSFPDDVPGRCDFERRSGGNWCWELGRACSRGPARSALMLMWKRVHCRGVGLEEQLKAVQHDF